MSEIEIANLEHASRAAVASWSPQGFDGRTHIRGLLAAMLPAFGILAAAGAFLAALAA
jgi:hypothetical protein